MDGMHRSAAYTCDTMRGQRGVVKFVAVSSFHLSGGFKAMSVT